MSKEKYFEVKAELKFDVSAQDIDDIMATALEGGISYWCGRAEVVGEYLGEFASNQISRGGSLILYDIETDDKWELTLDKLLAGIKMYVERGGTNIIEEGAINTWRIDGRAADFIVQYAVLGEREFG